jgi:hypothetical protein
MFVPSLCWQKRSFLNRIIELSKKAFSAPALASLPGRKRPSFSGFPYACPEPVLANVRVLAALQNGASQKRRRVFSFSGLTCGAKTALFEWFPYVCPEPVLVK